MTSGMDLIIRKSVIGTFKITLTPSRLCDKNRCSRFKHSKLTHSIIQNSKYLTNFKLMRALSFFEQVYEVVRLIPKGHVTSYGAIAAAIGAKKASRMVGYAMNNSHVVHPPVPAHRVVNRQGLLTGRHHFSPPELMEQLLQEEGIEIRNNQVQDFQKHFWDPLSEIQL